MARETYSPENTSIIGAAQRLRSAGGYDTVLIADRGARAAAPARELKRNGAEGTRILGTERWSGEEEVARSPVLEGSMYASVSESRLLQFVNSYQQRFGDAPDRLATLGYDAVLLTIRMTRDWPVGSPFPTQQLYNSGGFLGIDGPFRFDRSGIAQRALEVRRIERGKVLTADPAPASFGQ